MQQTFTRKVVAGAQQSLQWARTCILVLLMSPVMIGQQGPHAADRMPVIDMHFHTQWRGPEVKNPVNNLVSPKTVEDMRRLNIEALDRYHIVRAVASGEQLESYEGELGRRLLRGFINPDPSPATLRQMHKEGKLAALAEIAPQYVGLEPASPELEPYWALAEEFDLPVGIHMGPGPPGAAYIGFPKFRMRLGNPLLLEDVLVRHPKLRVYVMHAGYPFINEMIGLLGAHPQVYVDVGVINWVLPEAEFHGYLRRLVEAGFAKRIMFGSDNMVWPDSIGLAVRRTSAPFLPDSQKRDILCRNAAEFLRLDGNVCGQ